MNDFGLNDMYSDGPSKAEPSAEIREMCGFLAQTFNGLVDQGLSKTDAALVIAGIIQGMIPKKDS